MREHPARRLIVLSSGVTFRLGDLPGEAVAGVLHGIAGVSTGAARSFEGGIDHLLTGYFQRIIRQNADVFLQSFRSGVFGGKE